MDIAGLSMDLANISTMSKVGTAVLDKTLDTNEALGAGLVEMIDAAAMERSVNPAVGGQFDLRV
ncbi:MAG: YjfB family protein [Acetatifactor sp.]|nr:YjfB family protein [Acetatifactor sp.]